MKNTKTSKALTSIKRTDAQGIAIDNAGFLRISNSEWVSQRYRVVYAANTWALWNRDGNFIIKRFHRLSKLVEYLKVPKTCNVFMETA
jgi:hypothetical protein